MSFYAGLQHASLRFPAEHLGSSPKSGSPNPQPANSLAAPFPIAVLHLHLHRIPASKRDALLIKFFFGGAPYKSVQRALISLALSRWADMVTGPSETRAQSGCQGFLGHSTLAAFWPLRSGAAFSRGCQIGGLSGPKSGQQREPNRTSGGQLDGSREAFYR